MRVLNNGVSRTNGRARAIVFVSSILLLLLASAGVAFVTLPTRLPIEKCSVLGSLGMPDKQYECYDAAAHRTIQAEGPAGVVGLELVAKDDRAFHGACHGFMHSEGRELGKRLRTRAQVESTMEQLPLDQTAGTCGAGMTHGILEGYVRVHGLGGTDSEAFTIMCGKLDQRVRRYDCSHGLGHASMYSTKSDVPASAQFCLSMTAPDQGDCESAVLMTLSEGLKLRGGPMAQLRSAAELNSYCDRQPKASLITYCYRWIPLVSSFNPRLGLPVVLEACGKSPTTAAAHACYVGVGRQAPRGDDPRSCEGINDRASTAACSYGMLVGWTVNRTDVPAAVVGQQCAARTTDATRAACFVAIGRIAPSLKGYADDSREALCREAADVDPNKGRRNINHKWCIAGAQLQWEPFDYSKEEQRVILEASGTDRA